MRKYTDKERADYLQEWREIAETSSFRKAAKVMYEKYGVARSVLQVWAAKELVTTQKLYVKGKLHSERLGLRQSSDVDTEGMQVVGVTTSPYGGKYVKYKATNEPTNEELLEAFKEALADTKPVDVSPKLLGLMPVKIFTSDKHVGCPGLDRKHIQNVYNAEVYRTRMFDLLARVIDVVNMFGGASSVTYFDLGDNLDGYDNATTRGGHFLPQNLDSRDQFKTFLEVEMAFFDCLVRQFGKVEYVAQSVDNHSGAFGFTAYKALELYIQTKYPQCTTYVSEEFIDHVNVGDEVLLFCHGKDDKNMRYGLPFYPKSATTEKIREYMDLIGVTNKVKFVKGDLHQYNYCSEKKYNYINVPSIMGTTEWIYDNFQFSPPGAYLEVGNFSFPIWL